MASVNYPNPNVDPTNQAFANFYNVQDFPPADANTYDLIYSYLTSVFGNQASAKNLTYALFKISANSGTPIEQIFNIIKAQEGAMQVSKTVSFYLNNIRSNSTLIGVGNTVTPNRNVARNVLT
jgi:hypothetical protein